MAGAEVKLGWLDASARESVKRKLVGLYGFLLLFNLVVWVVLFEASHSYPYLLPLGLLAYVFGLRHACDADHIAAIDNTTRKLANEGKKPLGVGTFFSLGHSTIVILMAMGLALATQVTERNIPVLEHVGSIVGTLVSAAFLYLIAAINLFILVDVYRIFQKVRREHLTEEKMQELDETLLKRGFMNRILRGLFRSITASWQMYPVGVLFGLGFDTASEVALLGISAAAASKMMPLIYVIILPLMFTAGMCLVDTTDGVVMQYAYGWAFLNPIRKIYYNLSVTAISVLLALVVGGIEWLQVVSMEFGLKGSFWTELQAISFAKLGFIIIGLMLLTWLLAILIYKVKGYEREYQYSS
ncbi:HoxN/HupN/NixA family nickel/cobalt transporter [Desulfothermobacter acidiphilus]|uniref:HoxN/HupN/NixA family nickel/cobalt transporter n=1 Tax=Desulfothermobacter acidiphilus TaxID=1938353 RepID=UPI003F8B740C